MRFRTGRVYSVDGAWFFTTREGIDVGPYATELEAGIEAELLVQRLRTVPIDDVPGYIRKFAVDSVQNGGDQKYLNSNSFTDYVERESRTELSSSELFRRA